MTINLDAQLCSGSLGDPIINITFGSGTNPGAPLKAATTSYQYVSGDCPGDGYYTVRSNTTACFGDTWHSLSADHTGDPNGYFMLVNASFQPSAFYLDTVKGLCAGTTYEFAAWILNVLKPTSCSPNPINPNLTFTIEGTDGTVLQTYNTNTIGTQSGPVWKQYGFFFTTPPNASDIVLRIFNNAPGGCGNDLALDDITFRPCGPQLTPSIAGITGKTTTICEGENRSFTFNCSVSGGFNNPSFQWQQSADGINWSDIPLATNMTLTRNFAPAATPGNYFFRLSAAESGNMNSPQCRIASDPLTVKIASNPVTTASANSPVCEKSTLSLSATGGSHYQWSGSNNFSAQGASVNATMTAVSQSGKYYVLVKNDDGCENLDSVMVTVNPVPSAHSSFTQRTICEGEEIQLQASGGSTYQWSPVDNLSSADIPDPMASPLTNTTYQVKVFNQFGCMDTANVTVSVTRAPQADAGPDLSIIEGTSAPLMANAAGQDVSYSWSPALYLDNPFLLQPVVTPLRDTAYVLTVVSNVGCGTATDTVHVLVYKDVFVPTAFSPNNDGLNDTWNIPALAAYPHFELTVFNRYGNIVFQNKHSNKPWDGKYRGEPQPSGIYVYMIDLKDGNAILKGTLMLIR